MTAARRLLCVYQHAPTPDAPGIYRHRLYLSRLVERGWHVDLVSTPLNYMTGEVPPAYRGRVYVREEIDGIVHHWVRATGGIHASKRRRALNYATFAAAAAARAVTLPRPDAVLVSSPPLPVAGLGPLLSARFRRGWVLEVRDIWPESAASVGWLSEEGAGYRMLDRFSRYVTSSAAVVVVPTFGLVGPVLGHGAREVRVVPGAVLDTPPDDAARRRARAELRVDDATCLFVYVGAVGVANGLDLLLDAVRALPPSAAASMRFVVAGDGSARAALEGRVRDERLGTVSLVGPVPRARVAELLAASDVCLHLLRPDPLFATALPTKVLEYLGAHRPFVTTVPGLPERLAVRSGGGFAPSAECLRDELLRWATLSPAERGALGEQAFRFGVGRFGVDPGVAALEAVLAACAAGHRGRPAAERIPEQA